MSDEYFDLFDEAEAFGVSRAQFLKAASAAGVAVGVAGFGVENVLARRRPVPAPKRGGVLQLSLNLADLTDKLDPALQRSGNSVIYGGQVFEQLTRVDRNFEVTPGIAQRWEVSRGAAQWTFHLRPGVRFSDGTPVTAEDVAYTFRTTLDPKLGSGYYAILSLVLDPSGIKVLNKRTIRFRLKAPTAIFDMMVGNRRLGVVKAGSPRPLSSITDAIGSGPFRFKSFTPGQSWEMERHPRYWQKGLPYLEGIRALVASDAAALVRALSGTSHLVLALDFASAKSVQKSHKLIAVPRNAFPYIAMDQRQAPFTDPRVVEAVKLVVDRPAAVRAAFQGFATPVSDVLCPIDSPFYPSGLGVRKRNIARAKRLLAQAGHSDGLDLELFTAPFANGTVEFPTVFAEMARAAGINVKISQRPTSTYFSEVIRKKSMYVSFVNYQHPAESIGNRFTPSGAFPETYYTNPALTRLLARAAKTLDPKQRRKLYQQAWLHVANNAGIVVAASIPYLFGAKKNVYGVIPDGTHYVFLRKTYLA